MFNFLILSWQEIPVLAWDEGGVEGLALARAVGEFVGFEIGTGDGDLFA